jgi:hypothetical protein
MIRTIAFLALGLLLFAETSYAADECVIYRSLANQYRKTIESSDDAQLHYSELLKVRRADLAVCAEMAGFELDDSEEGQLVAAEACGEVYRQWVITATRLRDSRQARDTADKSIRMVNANLERYCGQLAVLEPLALRGH